MSLRSLALAMLMTCALGVDVGCATTQTVPADSQKSGAGKRKRSKAKTPKVAPVEDEPSIAQGPEVEDGPEAPPPEGELPWEEGLASFYADSLAGNRTANGERYRIDRRTCAHRTLPFGTVLEVHAPATGRTTTCRVNDRGPFAKQRVLDVSKKCARELGMIDAGVLTVRYRQAHDSSDPQ